MHNAIKIHMDLCCDSISTSHLLHDFEDNSLGDSEDNSILFVAILECTYHSLHCLVLLEFAMHSIRV